MLLSNKHTQIRDNHLKRRVNGIHHNHHEHHGSYGMLKLVKDNTGELDENNSKHSTGTNGDIIHSDDLVDEQCAKVSQ